MEKWAAVLISCVTMYVTWGEEGAKKSKNFADVIDGSSLTLTYAGTYARRPWNGRSDDAHFASTSVRQLPFSF